MALAASVHAASNGTDVMDIATVKAPGYLVSLGGATVQSISLDELGVDLKARLNGWGKLGHVYSQPVNWSGYSGIMVRIKNWESRQVNAGMLFDRDAALGSMVYTVDLGPNEERDVFFPLGMSQEQNPGMHNRPVNLPEGTLWAHTYSADRAANKISSWRLYLRDDLPATLEIRGMRLIQTTENYFGVSDLIGQSALGSNVGKISSTSQLLTLRAEEASALTAAGPISSSSAQVRATAMPRVAASGAQPRAATPRWSTAKTASGKWYLMTPAGKPFWAIASHGVRASELTPVDGRTSLFSSLPPNSGATKQYFIPSAYGTLFDVHAYTLSLKYGVNGYNAWRDTTVKRLNAWGVNMIGPASDLQMWATGTPFTAQANLDTFGAKIPGSKFPDPYAADFVGYAKAQIKAATATGNGLSNFVGLYVDNEINWGFTGAGASPQSANPLAFGVLYMPSPTAPAKAALISMLTAKYGTIARLNAAWGTTHASFQTIGNAVGTKIDAQMADLDAYRKLFARTYYTKVKQAIDAAGITGMYLGSRQIEENTPQSVLDECAAVADVLSFNQYQRAANVKWARFNAQTKPVIISEVGFWAGEGRGLSGDLNYERCAANLEDRKNRYIDYYTMAAKQPGVVGVTMFTYLDQCVTGRFDGENFNYGLVRTNDVPYSELTSALRTFAAGVYTLRGN
jgi:hypothetical protein